MKTDENITISRNVLMRLIKRNRQLIYMNFWDCPIFCVNDNSGLGLEDF